MVVRSNLEHEAVATRNTTQVGQISTSSGTTSPSVSFWISSSRSMSSLWKIGASDIVRRTFPRSRRSTRAIRSGDLTERGTFVWLGLL